MEYLLLSSKIVITTIYALTLTLLCTYGAHRYYIVHIYRRNKNKEVSPPQRLSNLPRVTIQLPIYNEMYVVERLISSVCKIDYPLDKLEIQVLDDSTDDTQIIACEVVNRFRQRGFDIHYIHREDREGYKAGALREGLSVAKGEFVAIFDADFIPPKNFLRDTIDYFSDPKIGIVQARWGHVNIDYSMLTKAQSILLDGHFMIEQTARFHGGMFFNFNGTAGVLRKECIYDAGGWQHDTLTEDLDLSYRAQLKGWKLVYLKDTVADAELPVDMNAFKSQQHRWAKGGVQTALKILPRLLGESTLPLKIKSEACFHLLGNLSYIFLLVLLVLMFPMAYFWDSVGWEKVVLFNLVAISLGTFSFFRFYWITVQEVHGENWVKYAKHVATAIALGAGISINNSKAVIEALLGKSSEFKRTPKFAVTTKSDNWKKTSYVSSTSITALIELTIGIFFLFQSVYAIIMGYFGWIPFLLIIQFGFIYTAVLSIMHSSNKGAKNDTIDPFVPNPSLQRKEDY